MWIVYSVILHIVLLGSIFVIYFRSPVITGLQPQPALTLQAPAKRLVLFVTDGLRAESFFHNQCQHIPHLKQLILKVDNGLVGVSHTRVPTESRPGHIALIAGLYEDPSAVTRGWKENPIEFDTVFNRSSKTYAWGAHDVLHIFSRLTKADEKRLLFDSYSHELDFSGKEKTYELDQWVFQRVKKLLARKSQELQHEQKVIFFLHLLGLDTAGHVHKPGSELFIENLLYTQEGVTKMYELFENVFKDGQTAYVLTSDHGMTNAGSHGAGDKYETETPFFIWGAGVNAQPNKAKEQYQLNANTYHPLYRMEQAQMAPLMSALLGIATPMNNFGTLPSEFLNTSMEYKYQAAHNNALQLVEQYMGLLKQHQRGWLAAYMPKYASNITAKLEYIEKQATFKSFSKALEGSNELMQAALQGIDYYFGYYRWPLLMATTATFVGFLAHLLSLLLDTRMPKRPLQVSSGNRLLVLGLGLVVLSFCILQKLALVISFYLLVPVVVWYYFITSQKASLRLNLNVREVLLLLACAELLVYTFFERRAISMGFLLFSIYEKLHKEAYRNKAKFVLGLFTSIVLAIFPLLPPSVGYSNNALLYLGIFLTVLRSMLVKTAIGFRDKTVVFTALANACLCIYMHSQQYGIYLISQIISWAFLVYVMASVLIRPLEVSLKQRLEKMIFLLTSLYCLFCTSYEAVFILLLITELISLVELEKFAFNLGSKSSPAQLTLSFRYAFVMILYTFFSFFGTGNIASISSFDPNIIRCFLTTFSPFVIMILVIVKLIIPLLLIMSSIFALSPFAVSNEKNIFICLLMLCDVMGLNFLFLVKNQGSWLEIGSSISHFVIMQVTTVVLALFVYLSKYLLKIPKRNEN
ncbi:GPI ethanolamine phosphate transferase 1 [Stomoxys calcitrans]|uniref:GPI ethanolamine phosphate transferase 1 n=1 Tax=Stomoxys calcitrans TaxID=35570 RepID=UPI0027E30F9F|nr:GPI ethanolamine phosphate transferase 1 [Stomoxys calcitrans]